MFFTEKMIKTLLLGILLSLAGKDYTSETSDVAVVSATAGNSGILGDLIEGPEAQCSVSQKSFVTESFDFGQNCSHFIDEPSLQCFPNLEKVQPLVVLHNVSENSETGKDFNLTVESKKNEWQMCETSTTPNSPFSFLKGRIAIADDIKYLLELDPVQKALVVLEFLLCFIWKYRTFLCRRLKTITKIPSKCTVLGAALVAKIRLFNSEKDAGISRTASEKSSLAENDAKLPERPSVNHGKTASFLNDLTISSVESDSKSGDSSDDEFPDEPFLVRCENGCIYFRQMLKEGWEPTDLAEHDCSSESHDEGKKGSTNVLQSKDWKVNNLVDDGIKPVTSPNDQHKITNDVHMNDLPLTSSSSEDQVTSSHTLENNTNNLFELKDLKGDSDSSVAPLGDQDEDTNPGEMEIQKFIVPSVDGENLCYGEREESTTNLARMKNWKLDNLSFDNIRIKNSDTSVNHVASSTTNIETGDWSLDNLSDEETIDDCPNSMIDDADLRFDDYIDNESDEEEFPDEFFLFTNPNDKTKNFISTKDLYPDDIVGYDEDEEEFPDEFFLFANPDDKTKTFIATKDLYPEDLVSYDDVKNSQNSDVMLLGDQSDVVTESSEDSLNCDEDVVDNTEDRGQDDTGREMNSVNGLTLLFLSVAFVLPCLILRSS